MATPGKMAVVLPPTKLKAERKDGNQKSSKYSKKEIKRLKRLRRLAIKIKQKKDYLLREIRMNRKSQMRGKLQWEAMCGEIKLKDFREEIEFWGEQTERLLTKKDNKIDLLLKTLDESQEMYVRSFSKHLEQLDYLNGCLETLRQSATAIYETQAWELIHDFMCELSYVQDTNQNFSKNMENVIYATNVVTKRMLRQNYELYMVRTFGEVSTEVEKRYILRNDTITKMRNLQDQLLYFMEVLKGDMVDVHKTEKFLNFMQRQRNYVVESHKLNNIERNCLRTIGELQQNLLHIEAETNRDIYGLKLEQAYFLEVKAILKNTIERNKALTDKKVLDASSESYQVLHKLTEIVKYGELLLNVGMCCRKFQTVKEKVLPLGPEKEEFEGELKMAFDIGKHLNLSEDDIMQQMDLLKNFWRRCANIKLHNDMLMDEKRKLNKENEEYRSIIRSMKKSDDVRYILQSIQIKQLDTRQSR